MFGGTSAYPTYIVVRSGACPYMCDLCSKTFSDLLFESVCPCLCDMCKETSSLQGQLQKQLELPSD